MCQMKENSSEGKLLHGQHFYPRGGYKRGNWTQSLGHAHSPWQWAEVGLL